MGEVKRWESEGLYLTLGITMISNMIVDAIVKKAALGPHGTWSLAGRAKHQSLSMLIVKVTKASLSLFGWPLGLGLLAKSVALIKPAVTRKIE